MTHKEKEKLTPEELARTALNEDADEYAKKGAELVASREWHRAYRQEGKTWRSAFANKATREGTLGLGVSQWESGRAG